MIGGEKLKQVEYKVKLYFKIMKGEMLCTVVVVLIALTFFSMIARCSIDYSVEKEKEHNQETILYYEDLLQNVNIENENLKDSVAYYKGMYDECVLLCDSLCEEIAVRDIKLARIAEYNRIAGQNNNIKYLRGWINRVLNN